MSRALVLVGGCFRKTTTCVNLAASLAAMQKRVLLVDCDPQGNATMASGINKFNLKCSICQVLIDGADIHDALLTETNGAFHLLPANEELTAAEVKLLDYLVREFRLRNALAEIRDNYDYIFIDCPPSLNLLTVIDTVDQLARAVNPDLKIEGILRTMFDSRNRLSTDVSQDLKNSFGDLVYKTIIPRNVRLAEAPSFGKPAMYYDKSSIGAKAYLALAGEMLEKDLQEAKVAGHAGITSDVEDRAGAAKDASVSANAGASANTGAGATGTASAGVEANVR